MSGEANFRPDAAWQPTPDRAPLDGGLQIGIAVLSIAAAYLVADTGPLQRWGFVLGLASQPLWFVATWRARQYGMLIVSIFYTGAWIQGIANRFTF